MESFKAIRLSKEETEQNEKELVQLFVALDEALIQPGRGKVKKITNTILNTEKQVDSWKFNEWDYSNPKVTLPTNARGLFTADNKILCRGYDKFFNVDESYNVSRSQLLETTKGPYVLTVKSNGCIAFISGLDDGSLIVCSKHSTGAREDTSKNHSIAIQEALERQLEQKGIDTKELGVKLFELGITAVAEFCDDSFEEHVLEYKNEKAGLYLHGLNLNTVKFKTYPVEDVKLFATYFGFKETEFVTFDTLEESFQFLDDLAKTGTYKGEEVEGFVIRSTKVNTNADFFFKYKFEEPYLLYRQLREVTKQYIRQGFGNLKITKHRLVCMSYLKFAIPILEANPDLKIKYIEGKGIVSLRKQFFDAQKTSGLEMIRDELNTLQLEEEMKKLQFGSNNTNRYVLVTISTIGCGKTTTSLTLVNLFPDLFGCVQSDDFSGPIRDRQVASVLEMMIEKPIVILDRNNHKFAERKDMFSNFQSLNKLIPDDKLKFICLNFIPNGDHRSKELWNLTSDRVTGRGDNHQSIKVESEGQPKAQMIMKGFINRFQPVNPHSEPDSKFDLIIDLSVDSENSSLKNAKTIIGALQKYINDIPIRQPTEDEFTLAFDKALTYKPTTTKVFKTTPTKLRNRKPQYFAISIPDRHTIIETIENLAGEGCEFYNTLKENERIKNEFHVTLIHLMSVKGNLKMRQIYNAYTKETFASDIQHLIDTNESVDGCTFKLPATYTADVKLKRLVWSEKLMCIEVEIIGIFKDGYDGNLLDKLGVATEFPHITIGTANSDIPNKASNELLSQIHEFNDHTGVNYLEIENPVVLNGLPLTVQFT
ncbi:hypothetical protein CANARDRAFT_9271 [[Candida] arabinofermentans NRRL YB-2248]|uniref:tRNA ligase n=1 Tax=[Candida] arabinofermentans NRRL YB-2248 TaxID=983967 RepID=A0A1E4SW71_9ASCO|nr:hypothetical protein CANARDRAFT_9271 [[Candida] arabinofermentans NRRL YB-2248]